MGRSITNNSSDITVQGTVNTVTSQGGRAPSTPSITSPTNNELISAFNPTFTSSGFFSYGSDTHSGSNWQVSSNLQFDGSSKLADVATNSGLTSYALPSNILPRTEGTYYVRARHVSSGYEASAFSTPQPFRISATLSATAAPQNATNFRLTPAYAGTGTPSSYSYVLSASSDLSSPVSSGSITSGYVDLAYSLATGLFTGTDYYLQLTSVGADTIEKTEVVTLSGALQISGSASATYDGTNVKISSTIAVVGNPEIRHQFSTTNTFDSITYETTSTSFSASNLTGISDRSQSYFYRPVAVVGNEKVQAQAPLSVGASFIYTSSTSTQTPAGYVGSIFVEAIGGGGSGAGAYSSGSGGSSGNFETATTYVTQQESLSVTVGAGGPANNWSGPSFTYAGQTSVSIGSFSLSAAGGRNATMNQQTRVYGQNTGISAYGGEKGNTTGVSGQTHPITGIAGGAGGVQGNSGGQGGLGYGAGGGGQTRTPDAGGSGGAGGGGGGAFITSQLAGNGQYANVGSGGAGANGAVRLTYQDW